MKTRSRAIRCTAKGRVLRAKCSSPSHGGKSSLVESRHGRIRFRNTGARTRESAQGWNANKYDLHYLVKLSASGRIRYGKKLHMHRAI